MSNLKGKTFEQQIKNSKIRLEARGQSRRNRIDHKTHSNSIALKRDKYLSDFADYIKNREGENGKLNQYINNEIIRCFLNQRTENLSTKTTIDYTRGFSALIDGLKSTGISVSVDKEIFNNFVARVKLQSNTDVSIKQNRDIKDLASVFEMLSQKNSNFEIVAKVQLELGLRVSEAITLVSYPDKYIKSDYSVHGLVGKGGFVYDPKPMSAETISMIGKGTNINYSSYQDALKEQNISSHDFRFTYVKNRMTDLLNYKSYKEALCIVSKEINHHRESITSFYLSQTSF